MLYEKFIKPLLFLFPPEKAHHLAMKALQLTSAIPALPPLLSGYKADPSNRHEAMGIDFPNRLGLAAGFDKDGQYIRPLSTLGFGFIEMGTVTPLPQSGNPAPRLFRLPSDGALINRMGFNNQGLQQAVSRLSGLTDRKFVLGANIGKNKITPNEEATSDYLKCFHALYPWADYFAVNVSSPNTPGLRALQEKEPLKKLLGSLQEANETYPLNKPILLKIAPDLNDDQIRDATDLVNELDISGLIATNTTITRKGLQTSPATLDKIGNGGLSGDPLFDRSTEVIRHIRSNIAPGKTIIGVGGISSGPAARKKIEAGADLVQIYTGFIFKGPSLIGEILKELRNV